MLSEARPKRISRPGSGEFIASLQGVMGEERGCGTSRRAALGEVGRSVKRATTALGTERPARLESREKAIMAAQAALRKLAEEVRILDLRKLSSVSDFFVMATAMSNRQLSAIAEAIEKTLKQAGSSVWQVEGLGTGRSKTEGGRRGRRGESDGLSHPGQELFWVLMDCGDVVVHILNPPARNFYQLERLWADAPRVELEPEPVDKTRS